MKKNVFIIVAILLLSFILTAPVLAENVLRWASQGDAVTFDPHSANMSPTFLQLKQVYEPLLHFDWQMKKYPVLAESWKIVDPTTWEFKIRRGVTFHDGTPLIAGDVAFSINRAKGPGSDIKEPLKTVKEIEIIDDYTVKIITDGPNPLLPDFLTQFYILSEKWCKEHNVIQATSWKGKEESFAVRHANGTGPFMLESREPDIKTVMVKNPKWWGLEQYPHNIDKMIYTPIANASTRVAALLSGEVDFLLDPPLQDLPRIEKNPNLKLQNTPQLRTIFYGLEQRLDELRSSNVKGKNPLKDVRVRKAMHMAIDIKGIQKKVMRDLSVPANIIVPPGIHGYPEDLDKARPPYDTEAAKKLLAEAGYPDGFEINLDCPNDRYNNDEKICQATVGMLGKIGIKVNLVSQPKSLHFPKITTRNTDFYMLGWGYAYPDAHFNFVNMMHSSSAWNGGGITNPRVDQLIDEMAKEIDQKKRDAMIREVFEITTNEQVYLPLHHQVIVWGMSKKVEIPIDPRDEPGFWTARLKN